MEKTDVLEFSDISLELSLKQGETAEGSFIVYAPGDVPVEGWIVSSQIRMECLAEEFIGIKETIPYRFSAKGAGRYSGGRVFYRYQLWGIRTPLSR